MDLTLTAPVDACLAASPLIDVDHPAIRARAFELRQRVSDSLSPPPGEEGAGPGVSDIEFVRCAFEFVRDDIAHSWDIRSRQITAKASDVLESGHGICYAKSHLLAALLRAEGVPCGLCYQKLVLFDDPRDGYSLHSLNAVYLKSIDRWVRVDARGNKPGVDACFDLETERLAFPIRPEVGEIDYPYILAEPPACIVDTLLGHDNCLDMYATGLPTDLELSQLFAIE